MVFLLDIRIELTYIDQETWKLQVGRFCIADSEVGKFLGFHLSCSSSIEVILQVIPTLPPTKEWFIAKKGPTVHSLLYQNENFFRFFSFHGGFIHESNSFAPSFPT